MSSQNTFILVNVIGGISVLGTYVIGITLFPEHRDDLWGGVQGKLRNVFVFSMLIAAAGYLTFAYVSIFQEGISSDKIGVADRSFLIILISGIFLFSASLWMPTLLAYILSDNNLWWIGSITSLWVTAISLLGLSVIVGFSPIFGLSSISKYLSLIGLVYITFHCLIIDGFIWVLLFHK